MPVISLPDREWIDLVGPMAGVEMVAWDLMGEPPRRDEISFVVPPYMRSSPWQRLALLPALRVVQLLTAGCETVLPAVPVLSLIHISEPTRLGMISYAVFCLKKKKKRKV